MFEEITMDRSKLNLAAVCRKTGALGPGARAVVWVQGCPFRCKGCISPDWIPFIQANGYHPQSLAEALFSDPEISGITISGGEPVMQASALVDFIQHGQKIRDINVIMFSGYYYENLLAFPESSPAQRLLKLVDVLIDGPYDEKLNNNLGLRGSSNQRIIHLTERLRGYEFEKQFRQTEIQISNGEIFFVGVPPVGVIPGVLTSLEINLDASIPGGRYEWT
jgi:anaerobic ribonucleoside-triphosphate reductase activating protein